MIPYLLLLLLPAGSEDTTFVGVPAVSYYLGRLRIYGGRVGPYDLKGATRPTVYLYGSDGDEEQV